MNVYVFPSTSVENIKRGIERQKWAVPPLHGQYEDARRTRAAEMPVGSAGLFYCSDPQFFTTPFVIESEPEDRAITDVWELTWYLPFTIRPLGNLAQRVSWDYATRKWPFVRDSNNRGGLMTAARVFAPIRLPRPEWDDMLTQLGVDPEEHEDLF